MRVRLMHNIVFTTLMQGKDPALMLSFRTFSSYLFVAVRGSCLKLRLDVPSSLLNFLLDHLGSLCNLVLDDLSALSDLSSSAKECFGSVVVSLLSFGSDERREDVGLDLEFVELSWR